MASRPPMFSGYGRGGFWKGKTALELFRFTMYCVLPVAASVIYANPERMHHLIMYLKFVEYPEAIPSSAIPIGDEVEKFRGAATFTKAATSSKVAIDSGGTSPVAQKKSWWVWW